MEGSPRTIAELVQHYNFGDCVLLLPCIFCGEYLTAADIVHFESAPLALLWRFGIPFGCCIRCCNYAGMYEAYRYFQGLIPAAWVECITGKTLFELDVRCVTCLRRCNLSEKLSVLWRQSDFFVIRNKLKTVCQICGDAWSAAHTP
ncbi:putative transforming protein E6 [Ovis aries papillomavirus 3]|uniref:Protein E6 n=1 Tax=Ovis aries papillomavirus 3 TaxID=634772 RepID=D5FL25_9PAPI|nr:putative transforming protein E6 [Ovis aries papillomavirus 3]ACO58656.1 putative transforming protein E6 [Ovis aries papillomavirus 3]